MSGCNRKSRDHITNIASRGGREGAWRRPVSINPDGTVLQEIMVLLGQDNDIRSEKVRLIGRYNATLEESDCLQ